MSQEEKIKSLLAHGVSEVVDRTHLKKTLQSGRKLRVKLGIDPTSPDLHLGHSVVLRKLKEFQNLGHKIILIIGDFTARIGDPSGKTEARKPITEKEIKANMAEYLAQAGKIIDIRKTETFYNSSWLAKEGTEKILELASIASIQQVLRRADFKKRLASGRDVTLLEILYPVFQGYDSYKVEADVEIGGTDQTFNLLMGRKVQRHFGAGEQDILTVELLEGLDGTKKMSKSVGNYIGLNEDADQMFGKIMSLPDKLVSKYFSLCTDLSETDIKKLKKELSPRDLKAKLGFEIAKIYHGEKLAGAAQEKFDRVFSKKETPTDAPSLKVPKKKISVLDLVLLSGVAKSKSEARRLIEQGGVKIDNEVKKNLAEIISLKGNEALKLGKKTFFRIS